MAPVHSAVSCSAVWSRNEGSPRNYEGSPRNVLGFTFFIGFPRIRDFLSDFVLDFALYFDFDSDLDLDFGFDLDLDWIWIWLALDLDLA